MGEHARPHAPNSYTSSHLHDAEDGGGVGVSRRELLRTAHRVGIAVAVDGGEKSLPHLSTSEDSMLVLVDRVVGPESLAKGPDGGVLDADATLQAMRRPCSGRVAVVTRMTPAASLSCAAAGGCGKYATCRDVPLSSWSSYSVCSSSATRAWVIAWMHSMSLMESPTNCSSCSLTTLEDRKTLSPNRVP